VLEAQSHKSLGSRLKDHYALSKKETEETSYHHGLQVITMAKTRVVRRIR
jgi:hypothetical protein